MFWASVCPKQATQEAVAPVTGLSKSKRKPFEVLYLNFYLLFIFIMHLSVCKCGSVHVSEGAHRGQKRAPDALALQLQAVVSLLV